MCRPTIYNTKCEISIYKYSMCLCRNIGLLKRVVNILHLLHIFLIWIIWIESLKFSIYVGNDSHRKRFGLISHWIRVINVKCVFWQGRNRYRVLLYPGWFSIVVLLIFLHCSFPCTLANYFPENILTKRGGIRQYPACYCLVYKNLVTTQIYNTSMFTYQKWQDISCNSNRDENRKVIVIYKVACNV